MRLRSVRVRTLGKLGNVRRDRLLASDGFGLEGPTQHNTSWALRSFAPRLAAEYEGCPCASSVSQSFTPAGFLESAEDADHPDSEPRSLVSPAHAVGDAANDG
jgi:hypothetical protein